MPRRPCAPGAGRPEPRGRLEAAADAVGKAIAVAFFLGVLAALVIVEILLLSWLAEALL